MRHHAVWDDVGEDQRFTFGARALPTRVRLGQPNGLGGSRRSSTAGAPPSPFKEDPPEVKLAMGLSDALARKGMGPNALHGTGIDVSRLATPEPRGSRFQRLSKVSSFQGKANGMLAGNARAVEHHLLKKEVHDLEHDLGQRDDIERQQGFQLRQVHADVARYRAYCDKLLAERDHPTRNTDRQRLHMREHVQRLRDRHNTQMEAITARAEAGEDPLDVDVRAFVDEQTATCDRQEAQVRALIERVNGYLRGSDEGGEGLLPSGQVVLFGSRATRLSLASSDVDLVLQGELTEQMQRAGGARVVIMQLVERLRADHPDIKFIDAIIPRCTFVETASGLTADITAGPALLHRPGSAPLQHSGELASAFVRQLQEEYPALRSLVLILKALLRRAHYHEPFIGGLSSHGLVMMVGTMLRVREASMGREAVLKTPLSVLLCEFLFLFGFEFDYSKNGISLRRGAFFDRVELGDFHAPLLVEDPLAEVPEDGTVVNITHVVTSTQILQGIFRSAYSMLTVKSQHSSLSLMASLEY